jgi:hypothetical protein
MHFWLWLRPETEDRCRGVHGAHGDQCEVQLAAGSWFAVVSCYCAQGAGARWALVSPPLAGSAG